MFNPSYVGPREDILRLVPRGVARVLDVGCSVGTLGQAIRERDAAEVTGIELDAKMGQAARAHLRLAFPLLRELFAFQYLVQAGRDAS